MTPYPWSSLDRLSRDDVETLRGVKRWARARLDLARAQTLASDLLQAPVRVRLSRAEPPCSVLPHNDGTRLTLGSWGADAEREALLEIEPALAALIVARALRRAPPRFVKPGVVAETVAGGAAAVLSWILRRALRSSLGGLHVAPLAGEWGGGAAPDSEPIGVSVTLLVGDEAFSARVWVARGATLRAAPHGEDAWSRSALLALGSTPLRLPVVACAVGLTATEIARIGPGDVLLADEVRRSLPHAGATGRAWLTAPTGEVGLAVDVVEETRVVLRGEPGAPWAQEGMAMGDSERTTLVEAIGDVPVVVRVEVGEAVMTAREWSSLAAGDVVTLGRRVGEAVLLRVGGVPIARGDLVDVEGEVGVRIVARLAEESTLV